MDYKPVESFFADRLDDRNGCGIGVGENSAIL